MVQQVIVQHDQSLDGLLHRRQLHQRHLPVLPVTAGEVTSSTTSLRRARAREVSTRLVSSADVTLASSHPPDQDFRWKKVSFLMFLMAPSVTGKTRTWPALREASLRPLNSTPPHVQREKAVVPLPSGGHDSREKACFTLMGVTNLLQTAASLSFLLFAFRSTTSNLLKIQPC